MPDFDPAGLNRIIHSPVRLGIMTVLNAVERASFNYLKKKLDVTDGNLSSHIEKLEEAGYISIKKEFIDKKPHTSYAVTEKGKKAFREYLNTLEGIIEKGGENEGG